MMTTTRVITPIMSLKLSCDDIDVAGVEVEVPFAASGRYTAQGSRSFPKKPRHKPTVTNKTGQPTSYHHRLFEGIYIAV